MKENRKLIIYIAVIALLVAISLLLYYCTFGQFGRSDNPNDWSSFGNYMAGTVGVLATILSVVLLYFNFTAQQKQNEKQEEINKQALFFKVLDNYNLLFKDRSDDIFNIYNSLQQCLVFYKEAITSQNNDNIYIVPDINLIQYLPDYQFRINRRALIYQADNISFIIKEIDRLFDDEEKRKYYHQIFINSISPKEKYLFGFTTTFDFHDDAEYVKKACPQYINTYINDDASYLPKDHIRIPNINVFITNIGGRLKLTDYNHPVFPSVCIANKEQKEINIEKLIIKYTFQRISDLDHIPLNETIASRDHKYFPLEESCWKVYVEQLINKCHDKIDPQLINDYYNTSLNVSLVVTYNNHQFIIKNATAFSIFLSNTNATNIRDMILEFRNY